MTFLSTDRPRSQALTLVSLAPLLLLAVAAPRLTAQWAATPLVAANPVITEGFLIVHDDGSAVRGFSAMAQDWMDLASTGSVIHGTGDWCALVEDINGKYIGYSARQHSLALAPLPMGGQVLDVLVDDDVALLIVDDGTGGLSAMAYTAQGAHWDVIGLGAVPFSFLDYGVSRFVAAVTDGQKIYGFPVRLGKWTGTGFDAVGNLQLDGNVAVVDVRDSAGIERVAALSGVVGGWAVSPETHPSNVTLIDHNVVHAMALGTAPGLFGQLGYSAYLGSWIAPTGSYVLGNWNVHTENNLLLLHDTFSDRYLAFGARPGSAFTAVPSNGPWSVLATSEDSLVLDENGTNSIWAFSGLSSGQFVAETVGGVLSAVVGPSHSMHIRDGAGVMHSFGVASSTWAPPVLFSAAAIVRADDAVALVEDGLQLSSYAARHNAWQTGPPLFPLASYSYVSAGSVIGVQQTSAPMPGDLRLFDERADKWDGSFATGGAAMYAGRNLLMFVGTSFGVVTAYSAQTNKYTRPPSSITNAIVDPGTLPTVEENVAWFSDGVSIVAYGSPSPIHTWHQWPRGTEYQVWASSAVPTSTRLDATVRAPVGADTYWLWSLSLLAPPLVGPFGTLCVAISAINWPPIGPVMSVPFNGSMALGYHGIPLPALPSFPLQIWTQGVFTPGLLGGFSFTDCCAEPAWIF